MWIGKWRCVIIEYKIWAKKKEIRILQGKDINFKDYWQKIAIDRSSKLKFVYVENIKLKNINKKNECSQRYNK